MLQGYSQDVVSECPQLHTVIHNNVKCVTITTYEQAYPIGNLPIFTIILYVDHYAVMVLGNLLFLEIHVCSKIGWPYFSPQKRGHCGLNIVHVLMEFTPNHVLGISHKVKQPGRLYCLWAMFSCGLFCAFISVVWNISVISLWSRVSCPQCVYTAHYRWKCLFLCYSKTVI